MPERGLLRLEHMVDAVEQIDLLLGGHSFEVLATDRVNRAAFERFLEIVSEASRHLPSEWKEEHPEVGWRQLADLGNRLRHAYHHVDLRLLWDVYVKSAGPLKGALDGLMTKYWTPEPPDA